MGIIIQDFGLADYQAIWALQKDLVEQRLNDTILNTLLVGEHPPVITLGRGSHAENLINPAVPVVEIERGGDVTYHGPGQLIAYPILKLPEGQRDLHAYLRQLEEAVILTVAEFGLRGERNPGWTGVWVQHPKQNRLMKIASIGVAVKKWVTYHGLALNVNPDLSAYAQINPCGLESQIMTSIEDCLGKALDMPAVKTGLAQQLNHIFAP